MAAADVIAAAAAAKALCANHLASRQTVRAIAEESGEAVEQVTAKRQEAVAATVDSALRSAQAAMRALT